MKLSLWGHIRVMGKFFNAAWVGYRFWLKSLDQMDPGDKFVAHLHIELSLPEEK